MTDTRNLLDEVQDDLLSFAPELSEQPLYVVPAELFAAMPVGACAYGWALPGPFMERTVIDRLGDLYHGPGPSIVLNFDAIEADSRPGQFERCARNVGLHEAAHILPTRKVFEPPDTTSVRTLELQLMERCWAAERPRPGSMNDPHDSGFVRRCTHLMFRALVADFDVTTDRLFSHEFWFSPVEAYLTLLLRECDAMRDASFAAIEATSPPDEFTAQWNADVQRCEEYTKYYEDKYGDSST